MINHTRAICRKNFNRVFNRVLNGDFPYFLQTKPNLWKYVKIIEILIMLDLKEIPLLIMYHFFVPCQDKDLIRNRNIFASLSFVFFRFDFNFCKNFLFYCSDQSTCSKSLFENKYCNISCKTAKINVSLV
jgi:hypothetical protein